MTENEIIKVLQNELECVKRQNGNLCDNKRDCNHCDLALKDETVVTAYENAIELINRQKAEIERLTETLDGEITENMRHKHEIERLNIELQSMRSAANSYKMHYETAKSEAYKECLAKVKNYIKTHCNPYGKPDFDYDTSVKILNFIDDI